MWFPPHSRSSAPFVFRMIAATFITCVVSGCASLSSIGTAEFHEYTSRSWDEIPVPVFSTTTDTRVAGSSADGLLIREPATFAWQRMGTSESGRSIRGVAAGDGEYRVLVIGSLAGDDPRAIQLTEKLARQLHENSIILGGITTTVIRNPNPDAESQLSSAAAAKPPLNRRFPGGDYEDSEPKEVRFLLKLLQDDTPHRVIHIRTHPSESGVIAADSSAAAVARDAAEWTGMQFIELPGNSRPGTLERYLSTQPDSASIVTFAIPRDADRSALWETYGDSLLNLLMDDDYESRELARKKLRPRSENKSRSRW